ncbi:hypothetical protein FOXYSP1_14314 [Fusarium oxysporum f. sp. phaseoli]
MTLNVKQQDAANVVWAAEAAEVGVTGSRGAQRPECRGDVKSSRSSVPLKTFVTKKGQLSESLSSSSC